MIKPQKYNSVSVYYDITTGFICNKGTFDKFPSAKQRDFIRLDSKHELRVYLSLLGYLPSNCCIVKDRPLTLDCGSGLDCYQVKWKPDFTVLNQDSDILAIVEAKGMPDPKFSLVLKLFASQYKILAKKTIVVFASKPRLLHIKPVKLLGWSEYVSEIEKLFKGN